MTMMRGSGSRCITAGSGAARIYRSGLDEGEDGNGSSEDRDGGSGIADGEDKDGDYDEDEAADLFN